VTVRAACFVLCLLCPGAVVASPLAAFAFQQRPGNQVPLNAMLRDTGGQPVSFGGLIAGQPVILALGYFHCPTLCGVVRANLMDALSHASVAPARYSLVVLSIDPAETPTDALDAERKDAAQAGLTSPPATWHYLTGSADQLSLVENAVGFHTRFDPQLLQFLHPTGLVILTARGTVSSYLLGVDYRPGDLGLALTRARTGGVEKAALPILLLCFHYDPSTGRYSLAIVKVLEIGCVLTVLTVGGLIGATLLRERRA
jgi:protein SCO1/2